MNNYEQKKGLVIGIISASLAVILIVVGLAKGGGVSSPELLTAAVGDAQGVYGVEMPAGEFMIGKLSERKLKRDEKITSTQIYDYQLDVTTGNKNYTYTANLKTFKITEKTGKAPKFHIERDTRGAYQFYALFDEAFRVTVSPIVNAKAVIKSGKMMFVDERPVLAAPIPRVMNMRSGTRTESPALSKPKGALTTDGGADQSGR